MWSQPHPVKVSTWASQGRLDALTMLATLAAALGPSATCPGTTRVHAESPCELFSCSHHSSVSTWPTRRCTTTSVRRFFYRSEQTVYKRGFPWKQLILLVTRQEFWIFFSRYSYNIIRYFTGCMHFKVLETKNFLSRKFVRDLTISNSFIIIQGQLRSIQPFSQSALEGLPIDWKNKK